MPTSSVVDPDLQSVAEFRRTLATFDQDTTDGVRIDRIRVLEELKGAVAAAQARETAEFVSSQKAAQVRLGVSAERVGRGVASQVGLARRVSPYEAARYVGQVQVLLGELPRTFAELIAGRVPEWRVLLVARETAWLSLEHRQVVDAEIAPQLERLGARRTINVVKQMAYRLDPRGYLARLERAASERRVWLRPIADGMTRLAADLPLKQGVAVLAALKSDADTRSGVGGDARSRSQVMADTLVERVTGQTEAGEVPVEVALVMTDQALFNYGPAADEPAHLIGGGAIPAELARRMVSDLSGSTQVLLRRLYVDPATGQLAAMESQSRLFTTNQRKFLVLRDQICRTPWCDAPVRHADHVVAAEDNGTTSIENGQGLCESCNYAKTAPGWRQFAGGGEVVTTTPTGHEYRSRAPSPPGISCMRSPVEFVFTAGLAAVA